MPHSSDPPDYIAGTWHILESGCMEYLFPRESYAWVLEPDGTLTEFCRSPRTGTVSLFLAQSLYVSAAEMEEFDVFSLPLDARFRFAGQKELFGVGKMDVYCAGGRTVLERG